ncbi:PTS sugar transporter subunit IIA [Carnobacterium gallinarum]|uniref:PTS sugar transporter subunit IIA n=1 Tax=Carnobacterium gallinarum TaxID=2749 RepID=UPI0005540834|nr:fructose PTS transporter subunit IIA [Carnobacterium gallinarum]
MELLANEWIRLDENVTDQAAAFQLIAKIAYENGLATSQAAVLVGLEQREAEGTTGMMDGFAIPHAKSSEIQQPAIIILKLTKGVEWNSMDEKPIDFVISLLIPEAEKGTTHLQLLSKVARLLMNEEAKTALKSANSKEIIIQTIKERIA